MLNKCCTNFNHLRARFCKTVTKSKRGRGRRWASSSSPSQSFSETWDRPYLEFKGFWATRDHTTPLCPFAALQQQCLVWVARRISLLAFEMGVSIRFADILRHCFYFMRAPHAVLCWSGWLLKVIIWDCNSLICTITQARLPVLESICLSSLIKS